MGLGESVKAGVTIGATIRAHADGTEKISLDGATPVRTGNIDTSAIGAKPFCGSVHFLAIPISAPGPTKGVKPERRG
jgi:hypothetical protein